MKEETFPRDPNSVGLQVKLDENLEKLDPFLQQKRNEKSSCWHLGVPTPRLRGHNRWEPVGIESPSVPWAIGEAF